MSTQRTEQMKSARRSLRRLNYGISTGSSVIVRKDQKRTITTNDLITRTERSETFILLTNGMCMSVSEPDTLYTNSKYGGRRKEPMPILPRQCSKRY